MASRIVVVRHGETEWSRSHQHTGLTDLPLTPTGEEQARALRAPLAGWDLALVLASPLQRAHRTAELAGLEPTLEPDLVEWDYGDAEGRTTAELEAETPGWSIWQHGPAGGEAAEAVGARVDRVLAHVAERTGEEDTACLVAHGHVLRVVAARWLGLPASAGAHFRLGTATLSVLGREHGRPVLDVWNAPLEAATG